MNGRRSFTAMAVALVLGGTAAVGYYVLGANADPAAAPARAAGVKPAAGTTAKPAPRPASRPAAKPAAATAPDAGAPASAAPTQSFGDWTYSCGVATDGAPAICSIVQELADPKTRATVFIWRISRSSAGTLVSDWQTPTGVLVNRGVVIDAGTPKPIPVPFVSCTNQHCDAVANLAADFVGGLGAATKATSTIYSVDGKGLTFTFSVKGLKDGLAALQK